ncbi:MAG TPA: hypothetical protein VFS21_30220 [Roseiflexaceae bacterium]|nr:hypothetical protein [Roseiflexaceae bacterium]
MADRSKLSLLTAVGREISGGAVPGSRYFGGLTWEFGPEYDIKTHRPNGFRAATTAVLNSQHTSGKVSGVFSYTEAPYLYAGVLGYNAITTPVGATNTRQQVINFLGNATTPITPQTYSIERGNTVRGDYCASAVLHELGVSWDRKNGIDINGAFFAQAYRDDSVRFLSTSGGPTGGSISVSVGGQAATVPWNATATQVKTLLEALGTVGAGNLVVSGGPLNTGPVRIQFADIDALAPVPTITVSAASLTGGTSPSASVSRMSPSATMLDLVPAGGGQIDVWMADSYANLNSSPIKLLRAFKGGWKWSGMHGPVWTANTDEEAWASSVETESKSEWSIEIGADEVGMPLLRSAKKGNRLFFRTRFTGPVIETVGGTTYYQQFEQDVAVLLTKVPTELKAGNNVLSVEYSGELAQDPTWGQAAKATFINTLAAF